MTWKWKMVLFGIIYYTVLLANEKLLFEKLIFNCLNDKLWTHYYIYTGTSQ